MFAVWAFGFNGLSIGPHQCGDGRVKISNKPNNSYASDEYASVAVEFDWVNLGGFTRRAVGKVGHIFLSTSTRNFLRGRGGSSVGQRPPRAHLSAL